MTTQTQITETMTSLQDLNHSLRSAQRRERKLSNKRDHLTVSLDSAIKKYEQTQRKGCSYDSQCELYTRIETLETEQTEAIWYHDMAIDDCQELESDIERLTEWVSRYHKDEANKLDQGFATLRATKVIQSKLQEVKDCKTRLVEYWLENAIFDEPVLVGRVEAWLQHTVLKGEAKRTARDSIVGAVKRLSDGYCILSITERKRKEGTTTGVKVIYPGQIALIEKANRYALESAYRAFMKAGITINDLQGYIEALHEVSTAEDTLNNQESESNQMVANAEFDLIQDIA